MLILGDDMCALFKQKPQKMMEIKNFIKCYHNMQSQSILRTSYGEFCHYLIGYSKEFGNMQMVPDITYKRRRFEVCNN